LLDSKGKKRLLPMAEDINNSSEVVKNLARYAENGFTTHSLEQKHESIDYPEYLDERGKEDYGLPKSQKLSNMEKRLKPLSGQELVSL